MLAVMLMDGATATGVDHVDSTAKCEALPEGWVGSSGSNACKHGDYLWLTGTTVSAPVPLGWICESNDRVMMGDESTASISCIPKGGGVPLSLHKIIGSQIPKSIGAYFAAESDAFAKSPAESRGEKPRYVDIAGTRGVAVVHGGKGFVDTVDKRGFQMDFISRTTVFEDAGAFYECTLQTTAHQATADLQHVYEKFCSSVEFDTH